MTNQRREANPITVLISCVGRMAWLVRQFQSVYAFDCRVIAVDSDPLAAGLAIANSAYIAPRFDSPIYGEWMIDLCKREAVSLLLTLVPEDLIALEQQRVALNQLGVHLIGMRPEQIKYCLDKRLHKKLCNSTGFKIPYIWKLADIDLIQPEAFPLVAKEAKGRGSRGIFWVADKTEAKKLIKDLETIKRFGEYFLQSVLKGQEFGLDLVNGLDGRPAATFVRRKIRMRDGETEIAETVADNLLSEKGWALAERLGHQGLVDCDIMRCTDGDYLLDINPRFGGGYIFSHEAGANVPAAILSWLTSEQLDPKWLAPKSGVISARVSHLQCLSKSGSKIAIITTGSLEIGMGHASRQLTLATFAQKQGHLATIVTDSELVASLARTYGIPYIFIKLCDSNTIAKVLHSLDPTCVVIDVHERNFPAFEWIADKWRTILVVSRVGCDFNWYGSDVVLVGENLDYWRTEQRIVHNGRLTLAHSGRAFVFFRDEFTCDFFVSAKDRTLSILIAHGGSDPYGLTSRCLDALEHTQDVYTVKILIGAAFEDTEIIRRQARESKHHCEVIEGATEVAGVMGESAVALINGGNIRYELCVAGTPFVAISFQPRQYECTEQMVRLGVGINLGVAEDVPDERIASTVENLVNSVESRIEMQEKMRSLFDTNGVSRILSIALGLKQRGADEFR